MIVKVVCEMDPLDIKAYAETPLAKEELDAVSDAVQAACRASLAVDPEQPGAVTVDGDVKVQIKIAKD